MTFPAVRSLRRAKKEQRMKAVFYCSACSGIDSDFNEAAREIVRAACNMGCDIVSGGTVKGTMNVVSDTASECGAKTIGIVPRFMEALVHPGLTETVWTDTMSERKEKMREGISAAVALPGGIGTLDELIETMVLSKLGLYGGKIIVANIKGFYNPLKQLLDHYVGTGMLDETSRKLVIFSETVEEVIDELRRIIL